MRKLLSILLALALLLPAGALAEQVIDLGFCGTLHIDDSSYAQPGDEASGIIIQIFPDPYAEVLFHDNINVVWADSEIEDIDVSAEEFAQSVVEFGKSAMLKEGVVAGNENILIAEIDMEERSLLLYYTLDVDYSGMGMDLQLTLHFVQMMQSSPGEGMYTFTCTSASNEGVVALLEYIENALVPN